MRPIDADILRERLQDLAYDDWNQGIIKSFADACNEIIEIVEEQPTVNAVPVRHGKWIDMDVQSYTWKVRCSVCGHERSMMSTQGEYPKYCEECGARMD